MLSKQNKTHGFNVKRKILKQQFSIFILLRSSQCPVYITWITLILILASCNTTEPPPVIPPQPKPAGITLKLITKSSTEIFLTVSAKDTLLPAAVTIKRDDTEIMNFYLTQADTTIIDTALAAGKTYSYKPIVKINGKEEAGDSLFVTTLDTTSSSFTWQKYSFGDGGSNIFRDAAIISENDIWVVGGFYMNDSTGQIDLNAYNAVHWDGNEWKLKRIYYYGNCSAVKYPPLKAIWAFSKNNIVITNGGSIGWFNGNTVNLDCGVNPLLNGAINKIWGKSNNNLYVVGNNGSIAHYNGTSWTKIESGTDYSIKDIYGDINPITGKTEILCSASARDNKDSEIIKIKADLTTEKLDKVGLGWAVGIWFRSGIRYYVTGDGLFEKKYNETNYWVNLNEGRRLTSNFMSGIGSAGLNDIVVSGTFGEVLHYNGINWKSIKNDETTLVNGWYGSVSVKGNKVVAVGLDGGKAVILVGKRN